MTNQWVMSLANSWSWRALVFVVTRHYAMLSGTNELKTLDQRFHLKISFISKNLAWRQFNVTKLCLKRARGSAQSGNSGREIDSSEQVTMAKSA